MNFKWVIGIVIKMILMTGGVVKKDTNSFIAGSVVKKYLTAKLLFIVIFMTAFLTRAYGSEDDVSVTLSFAGDCTLGIDSRYGYTNSLADVFIKQERRYGYFLENVAGIFSRGDFTVVNLEGPLTAATAPMDKEFRFVGPPEFVNILQDGGVGAVNLANNHIGDYYDRGISDTKAALDGAGVGYFGAGGGFTAVKNGVTIGFLGYKGWSSGGSVKNAIANDIGEMRANGADIVAVSFHWGEEQEHYPNAAQKDLGRSAIDAGADVVFGHHPHVIQGIEEYNGKFIVYSLGNFCYGGHKNPADKDTFIFQMSFTLGRGDGPGFIIKDGAAAVYPCLISSTKGRNDYRPTPAKGEDRDRIIERLSEYSSPFGDLNESVVFAE